MTAAGAGDEAGSAQGGIEELARLLGAYAWIEGRLFEILGSFASGEEWAEAAVFFDAASQQHAWHASLFAERIPLLPGAGAAELVRAPGPELSLALELLAGAEGASRLALLGRVLLPRLVTGYRRHRRLARPWSDAPVVRALRLVVRDEVEAGLAAEDLLERRLAGLADPAAALARAADLEAQLAGAAGLVPWAPWARASGA